MLYLGMDIHGKQVTVSVRDEDGRELFMRQVSTRPAEFAAFLSSVAARAAAEGGFMATLEVCGFHDWVVEALRAAGCARTVLVQPEGRSRQKTDKRDARKLSSLLWVNRGLLAAGERPNGLRVVEPPSQRDAAARRVTAARVRTVRKRTASMNGMRRILRRPNLQHGCPTKSLTTKAATEWLRALDLDEVDRCEMDSLRDQWQLLDGSVSAFDAQMRRLAPLFPELKLLRTIPGVGLFVGLTIACRVGTLSRFARGRSLANFWGLAPGINDSGDRQGNVGSITKRGSAAVRYALNQSVLHVLRNCATLRNWHRGIRRRRGAKTARVAVMRRLATIIHRMLERNETFEQALTRQPAPAGRGV